MKKTARFNFISLFRLIKSLTMSERIYFKKFASVNLPHEEGELVELFNLLEGMSVFELYKLSLLLIKKGLDKAQAIFQ